MSILAGEIVVAGDDFFASADWTACAVVAAGNVGLPFVAVLADPPHWTVAARQHVRRLQIVIFCRMPGGSDGWVAGSEIVHAFYDTSPVTIFTPTGLALDRCLSHGSEIYWHSGCFRNLPGGCGRCPTLQADYRFLCGGRVPSRFRSCRSPPEY